MYPFGSRPHRAPTKRGISIFDASLREMCNYRAILESKCSTCKYTLTNGYGLGITPIKCRQLYRRIIPFTFPMIDVHDTHGDHGRNTTSPAKPLITVGYREPYELPATRKAPPFLLPTMNLNFFSSGRVCGSPIGNDRLSCCRRGRLLGLRACPD